MIDAGFDLLAERFNPILDVFGECGVRFASSIRPRSLLIFIQLNELSKHWITVPNLGLISIQVISFGREWTPSSLFVPFLTAFITHIKDAIVKLNGTSGILASHINFGDHHRGWDFRSPGRGNGL